MSKPNKTGRKKHFLLFPVIFAAVLLVGAIAGTSYAKYIRTHEGTSIATAKEFYFESNYLTDSGADYVLNPDVTSVSFTLSNHPDNLRFTTDNMEYAVTVSPNDDGVSLSPASGTLTGSTASDVTITLSNMQPGVTYTVTATGTAGYSSTLTATFRRRGAENHVYKSLDATSDPAYVLLTVWTEDISGTVSITKPDGVVLDTTTDPGNSLGKYSSLTYRYFKKNRSAAYSAADFPVTVDGTEAVEAG